jgi:hypothetical protein
MGLDVGVGWNEEYERIAGNSSWKYGKISNENEGGCNIFFTN